MSTTTDREVALAYARNGKGGLIFEIRMGMVDRGADLSWLSQYPHEAEVLFAPLTGIEVHETRVEGSAIVVEVSLSVNLTALTIEQVVAKLQRSHLSLSQILVDGLRAAEAPPSALRELDALREAAGKREPAWFNDPDHYQEATLAVLEAQRGALRSLADGKRWRDEALRQTHDPGAVARRMRSCASLCARSGELGAAAALLELEVAARPLPAAEEALVEAALSKAGGAADAAVRNKLRAAALLARDGLLQPWPPVVVELCRSPAAAAALGPLVAPLAQVLAYDDEWKQYWKARIASAAPPPPAAHAPGSGLAWADFHAPRFTVNTGSRRLGTLPAWRLLVVSDGGPGALLREAAAGGCAEAVTSLAAAGVHVLEADDDAQTALHHAIRTATERDAGGRRAVCHELLKRGWHTQVVNRQGHDCARLAVDHADLRRLINPCASDLDLSLTKPGADSDHDWIMSADSSGWDGLDFREYGGLIHADGKEIDAHPLLSALRAGRIDEAKALVAASPAAVNQPSETIRLTPLMCACRAGDVELARLLLDAKADVHAATRTGCTPLSIAADSLHHSLVPLLAGRGANLNSRLKSDAELVSEFGMSSGKMLEADYTPLLVAVHVSDFDSSVATVAALLEARADVNAVCGAARVTALLVAAEVGAAQIVLDLLKARADINQPNQLGQTPLMRACVCSHGSAINTLLAEGADVAVQDRDGLTAMLHACENMHGSDGPVRKLLPHTDINQLVELDDNRTDGQTMTALMGAARGGSETIVRLLLEGGAVIDQPGQGRRSWKTYSALNNAVRGGHVGAARALLQFGANPSAAKADGFAVLMEAAWKGNEPLVRMLCEARADLEARMVDAATPGTPKHHRGHNALCFAAEGGEPATVAALLQAGAAAGMSVEAIAQNSGHPLIARLLREHLVEQQQQQQQQAATPAQ